MKTMYIPKGITIKHENLTVDTLVVEGSIEVTGVLKANKISGNGFIYAEKIICSYLKGNVMDANLIHAKQIVANKIFCSMISASHKVIAWDYIEAYSVNTSTLIMTLSQIDHVEANAIIHLKTQGKGILGMLFCAWLKEKFLRWQYIHSSSKRLKNTEKEEMTKEIKVQMNACREYAKKGYKIVLEPMEDKVDAREKVS